MNAEAVVKHCNQIIGGNPYSMAGIIRSNNDCIPSSRYKELITRIEAFSGSEGWLCFQSGVHRVSKGDDLTALPTDLGRVLNGELAKSDESSNAGECGKTLSIQQSNDQWFLATIEETLQKSDQVQAVISSSQELCVLSRFSKRTTTNGEGQLGNNDRTLNEFARYRVYFELDESGYKPFCYRFVRFVAKEDRS